MRQCVLVPASRGCSSGGATSVIRAKSEQAPLLSAADVETKSNWRVNGDDDAQRYLYLFLVSLSAWLVWM